VEPQPGFDLQRSSRRPNLWSIGAFLVVKSLGIRAQLLGLVAAAVLPFPVLIGAGLSNQSDGERAGALNRALSDARVLAAQVDDYIGNVENLMIGLAFAISTNPADTAANDALLRSLKAKLPDFIADIIVATPDGENIGSASGKHYRVGDRPLYQQIRAGGATAVGEPLRSRVDGRWVFPIAHAMRNSAGGLQAVLTIGTLIESFQDALRIDHLPDGSTVRIVNERGIAIAAIPDIPDWVGRDLSAENDPGLHLAAGEGSELTTGSDNLKARSRSMSAAGSSERPARRRPSGEARDSHSPVSPSTCFPGSCTTIR
jgi:Cache domain